MSFEKEQQTNIFGNFIIFTSVFARIHCLTYYLIKSKEAEEGPSIAII